MSSNDTASILARLSLAPAGSFVVYDAGSGWCFTAHMDELHEAHVADIAVGAHPYAAVTLSHDGEETPPWASPRQPHETTDMWLRRMEDEGKAEEHTPLLPEHLSADRDGISIIKVLADWMEWCDAVMAEATARWDGEDEEDTETCDHVDVVEAMRTIWRVTIVDADRLTEINAAA